MSDLLWPLINKAQEFQLLTAVLSTQSKQWPDKFTAIVDYVGIPGLTPERALVIAKELLRESPELSLQFNAAGLSAAREEICGGVHIYPHITCPMSNYLICGFDHKCEIFGKPVRTVLFFWIIGFFFRQADHIFSFRTIPPIKK
jgi:hypothetical protein